MGDREMYVEKGFSAYFEYLEAFMNTVTRVVEEDMGMQAPLFHVFSETMEPCPNTETGIFDEFPEWPVQMDQVRIVHASRNGSFLVVSLTLSAHFFGSALSMGRRRGC